MTSEDKPKVKKTVKKVSKVVKDKIKDVKIVKDTKKSVNIVKNKSDFLQPSINIGLVGHVDHGKTTLTERLSGKWTDTHSEEMKRGITIKLGYADTVFYKCPKCAKFLVKAKCHDCGGVDTEVVRKVSFVDAPGHESLMATMLAGTTVMDGAILLVAANEVCPQPQTREHLMALQISGIKNVIIAQNKIDLVDDERALKNHVQIREFLKGTAYEDAPIIPLSAQHGANIHFLISAIEERIPTPDKDKDLDPLFLIARSFDVNKPGSGPEKLTGGILGGALVQGSFKVGDKLEIRPGRVLEEHNQLVTKPLFARVVSITSGGSSVDSISPGGSIGVMTSLDPSIVKSDNLVGNVAGFPGKLPPVWTFLKLEMNLLNRVVGSQQDLEVQPLRSGEVLMLNVNSAATVGQVVDLGKNIASLRLRLPVCADVGARVSVSRKVGNRFRLIGFGIIKE
ncbi:translation initiation factor IF-2 subunit gamma [Candidatus Woesearchaeota archaeon]|nr:translation initiation factor IF-2 subunit gamma [Candidatus Woesearchaeota archaeon]